MSISCCLLHGDGIGEKIPPCPAAWIAPGFIIGKLSLQLVEAIGALTLGCSENDGGICGNDNDGGVVGNMCTERGFGDVGTLSGTSGITGTGGSGNR